MSMSQICKVLQRMVIELTKESIKKYKKIDDIFKLSRELT